MARPGEFGARCPGPAGTRAHSHHIRCTLNSLSFLSPPRLSPASTWGIFVVSVSPCPSLVLWDPWAAGRAGGFLSLAAPCAPNWESQHLPELPQIPIPISSDLSLAQERELWSPALLEHQQIHGISGNLNNKDTTAFSGLSGLISDSGGGFRNLLSPDVPCPLGRCGEG